MREQSATRTDNCPGFLASGGPVTSGGKVVAGGNEESWILCDTIKSEALFWISLRDAEMRKALLRGGNRASG